MIKYFIATLGIILTSNSYAYDLSNKHYLGFAAGVTKPFYRQKIKNSLHQAQINLNKISPNAGLVLGTNNQRVGAQIDFMFLNHNTYSAKHADNTLSFTDIIFIPSLAYNFFTLEGLTFKGMLGFGYMHTTVETELRRVVNNLDVIYNFTDIEEKIVGKLAFGLQYAVNEYLSLASYINYLKPFNHCYMDYLMYANLGINLHF